MADRSLVSIAVSTLGVLETADAGELVLEDVHALARVGTDEMLLLEAANAGNSVEAAIDPAVLNGMTKILGAPAPSTGIVRWRGQILIR